MLRYTFLLLFTIAPIYAATPEASLSIEVLDFTDGSTSGSPDRLFEINHAHKIVVTVSLDSNATIDTNVSVLVRGDMDYSSIYRIDNASDSDDTDPFTPDHDNSNHEFWEIIPTVVQIGNVWRVQTQIASGSNEAEIEFILNNDITVEGREEFIVELLDGPDYDVDLANNVKTVAVIDDDLIISFHQLQDAYETGYQDGVFEITSNYTDSNNIIIPIDFSLDNTSEYTAYINDALISNFTTDTDVNLDTATNSAIIRIVAKDDSNIDGDIDVTCQIEDNADYYLHEESESIKIFDRFCKITDTTSATANETDGTINLDLNIEVVTSPADLDISLSIEGTSSASAGNDYENPTGTLTIPSGSSTGNFPYTITIINDNEVETDETIIFSMSAGPRYSVATIDESDRTLTIQSDDTPPAVSIIANNNFSEGNTGTFTVSHDKGNSLNSDLIVYYTITGTATESLDYATLSGNITIPALESSTNISITSYNDNFIEGDETITLSLSSDIAYSINTSNNSDNLTITDDASTIPEISISSSENSINENGTNTESTITLSYEGNAYDFPIIVFIELNADSSADTDDFDTLFTSYTIPAHSNSVDFILSAVDDNNSEGGEFIQIALANFAGYTIAADAGSIQVGIFDDEKAELGISDSSISSIRESEGNLVLEVGFIDPLGNPSEHSESEDITVSISISSPTNDAALASIDMQDPSGDYILEAGNSGFILNIPVHDDFFYEQDEFFTLNISLAEDSPIHLLTDRTNLLFTIINDDNESTGELNSVAFSSSTTSTLILPDGFDTINSTDSTIPSYINYSIDSVNNTLTISGTAAIDSLTSIDQTRLLFIIENTDGDRVRIGTVIQAGPVSLLTGGNN